MWLWSQVLVASDPDTMYILSLNLKLAGLSEPDDIKYYGEN